MNMGRILQWNCRGLVSNWAESKMFFLLLAPIVIALQETWLLPTDPYNFSLFNYSLYRYDETEGERRNGGAALYINNDFVHQQITLNTPLQAVACTIRLNGRNIDVCSIYIPPSTENSTLERNLNQLIAQFQHPFLLLGDFNAHSPMWARAIRASDGRGDIIERLLDINHLVLLNKGDNTHFSLAHNTESAIDLSICSPQISTWFDWSVDCDIHHSDHYPIKLQATFSSDSDAISTFVPRWNIKKANWEKFAEFCNIEHDRFHSPEEGINFLSDVILSAAKSSIPCTKPPSKHQPVPWWSMDVARARAKRKRAFRRYLRLRDNASLIARNKERATCRKIIRQAKKASWRSFLSQLNYKTPLSKIWSLVRSLSGKRCFSSLPMLHFNNITISEPQAIVDTIAGTFARCSSSQNYRNGFIEDSRRTYHLAPNAFHSNDMETYNDPFSLSELRNAIYSTGNTSVGPDKLHYAFFRYLPDNTLEFMLVTLNDLWTQHIFPDFWRSADIIPVPKPGKDRRNPENYRPISLTSCFGKIFERMVGKRLEWFLEENNLLSTFQSGFRKNHSTNDHIIRLETDIRKGFKYKKHTTSVFLDISKAYDMVYKPALIFKLHRMGLRGHLAHYLLGFLSGIRSFQVRYRSIHSHAQRLENGLPQGSCLSPMLFNVMINDIFDTAPAGINYSIFADDCAIWCTDSDAQHSIPRLQQALDKIDEWSRKNGFIFSPMKSAVMLFTKNTRVHQTSDLRLSGNIIPRVGSFKFLGVVLDSRLSMVKHVQHIKTKCARRLNLFRCIAGTDFGADRETLLRLYKTLVLPIIEFGATIYSGASDNTLKKLDIIQNSFIRIATGAMKTSPIPSLQVEAVVPPLHIRRMEQSLRYFSKVASLPNHNTYEAIHVLPSIHHNYVGPAEKRSGLTIASRAKKFSTELNYVQPEILPLPRLDTPPWRRKEMEVVYLLGCCKKHMSASEIQQKFLELCEQLQGFKLIYTDGSKDAVRTSNAVFSDCDGRIIIQTRLRNETSIYIAELHAVLEALKLTERKHWNQVAICTDSRSVVQSLQMNNPSSALLIHIYNIHETLSTQGVQIKFVWIPGHSGIHGNIQADKYAKDALALDDITNIQIEYQSIKTLLRQKTLALWKKQWTDTNPATQLRRIKADITDWQSSNRSNRQEEKVLARMRLGHTILTHSYIYTKNIRPTCARCATPITVEHLLIVCPKYHRERVRLIDFCNRDGLPFTLETILGDVGQGLLDLLFSFLRDTNLFTSL